MKDNHRPLWLCLLACLFLRAFTLGYPDLIDPTESRYAFVGQEMALSEDWVVPKLPVRGEIEPYLGKPPFHFWLTAAALDLFGMTEWSARFPSFLALTVICLALAWLGSWPQFRKAAPLAALMVVSSGFIFYLSGASVVDLTLSACTTVAFVAALALSEGKIGRLAGGAVLFAWLGLGMLTKGPVALAIVGLPLVAWIFMSRRHDSWKKTPWIFGCLVFVAITVPWFMLAQSRNSDFLRYFFLNENFGRYLLKDYGDRYGTGHRYPFGTVWLMFLMAFFPWCLALLQVLWMRFSELATRAYWTARPVHLFLLLWAISPAFIFTFARQLHPAYVLPGMPGLALLTALLIEESPSGRRAMMYRAIAGILAVAMIGVCIYGVTAKAPLAYWLLAVVPAASFVFWIGPGIRRQSSEPAIASLLVAAYCVSTLMITDAVSLRRSSRAVLTAISREAPESVPVVSVVEANDYSFYFYTRAWPDRLDKRIQLNFMTASDVAEKLPKNIIVHTKDRQRGQVTVPPSYREAAVRGRWTWMVNSAAAQ